MPTLYDIAILGGSPAAYAAGAHAAGQKAKAIVIDCPARETESPLGDWVPASFFRLAKLPRGLTRKCKARAFRDMVYHSAALDQRADYKTRSTLGHVLSVAELKRALRAAAKGAGATARNTRLKPTVHLEEDHAEVRIGKSTVRAKVLIVCRNEPADIISELGLPVRLVPSSSLRAVGLNVPIKSPVVARELAGALHIVEQPERSELGMFFVVGRKLHLRVVSTSLASGNRAAELSDMLSALQAEQIVPRELPLNRADGAVWTPPAGVALELETHVAKRCLLAGTAGGFAESITGHTLYPATTSALLATDTALHALSKKHPQEELMHFKTLWRKRLADYLRPPNTSLRMLLPLLFANQRVVGKFSKALLWGENI